MENTDHILEPESPVPSTQSETGAAQPIAVPAAEAAVEAAVEAAAEPAPEPIPEPIPEPTPAPMAEAAAEGEPVMQRDMSRRRSPYDDSPFQAAAPVPPAPPRKAAKARKASRGWGSRILAAVLTVVLVCSACGITAWQVNRYWEKQYSDLEGQMDSMQSYLEGLIQENSPAGTGNSVSGSPVTVDGLTPSQVYAQNVDAVGSINTDMGSGTGFVISEDGYVLSNYHVVEGANRIQMTLNDGRQLNLTLIGYYQQGDVALLKADAAGLQAVKLGSSDDLIVGDMVVAIGNPLGELAFTQTVGYVSGKDRLVTTDGTATNMIQVDAAVNPGNSGGPLFNMKGEVVGIISAKYSGTTSSGATIEGLGFAIPMADVQAVLGDLMEHGYVTGQAYLGVMVYTFETSMGGIGCYVDSTTPGGAADRAGIRAGDIITAVDDHQIKTMEQLTAVLAKYKAGDTVTVTFLRSWQAMQTKLTFDERPQE